MKMNRTILRKHIKDEVIVTRIMNKAQNSIDIKTVCKMGTSATGATCSFLHFNIDNWIEAQEKHLKSPTIRKDAAKRVESTMNLVKSVRDKILKDEMKDNYTLECCGNNIMVWKCSKMVAQGFGDDESALHAIWVLEGKNINDFYVVSDGVVKKVERDTL